MQLVVVIAVRKAVSAATTTFTATSIILFFILHLLFYVNFLGAFSGSNISGTDPSVFYFVKRWGSVPRCSELKPA